MKAIKSVDNRGLPLDSNGKVIDSSADSTHPLTPSAKEGENKWQPSAKGKAQDITHAPQYDEVAPQYDKNIPQYDDKSAALFEFESAYKPKKAKFNFTTSMKTYKDSDERYTKREAIIPLMKYLPIRRALAEKKHKTQFYKTIAKEALRRLKMRDSYPFFYTNKKAKIC